MNKICACPVGSLFASIPPLYKKELIRNELPLAFCTLSHSPEEFYILSPLDHHLLILKTKTLCVWGCLNAEIPAPCKQVFFFFPNPVRIELYVYFMLSQMLLVSKSRRLNLFSCGRTASVQPRECFQVFWEQINVSDFRTLFVFKEKGAFGEGFDSLLFLFVRRKKKKKVFLIMTCGVVGGMLGKLLQKSNSKQ